jgi:hypothetical protein
LHPEAGATCAVLERGPTMSSNHAHLDFSAETWDRPTKFFDKCWVISTRHNPGLNTKMELNNRTFVFQLRGRQPSDVLLVFGVGGPTTLDAVRAIERETGCKVAWVVGNGGSHHLFLELWYEAFPAARVLIPAKRIPSTRNGQALAQKYADRWELMHGPQPTQLLEEFGEEIDVVIFDQLMHFRDQHAAEVANSPQDHRSGATAVGGLKLIMSMMTMMKDTTQPTDEVTFFHRASGLVIGGHNYQLMYVPKDHAPPPELRMRAAPFPMNLMMLMMMPKGAFVSGLEGNPGPIADSRVHADEWNLVLGWDIRAWTGAHNPPTVVGPDLSGAEIKQAIRASIARTGEDDPTGARLKWNIKNRRT